jgi:hypothetical protein
MGMGSDEKLSNDIEVDRSCRKELMIDMMLSLNPRWFNFDDSLWWLTKLKYPVMSKKRAVTFSFLDQAS